MFTFLVAVFLNGVYGDIRQRRDGKRLENAIGSKFSKSVLHADPQHIVNRLQSKHRRWCSAKILECNAIIFHKSSIVTAHNHALVLLHLADERSEIVCNQYWLAVETCSNLINKTINSRHQEYIAGRCNIDVLEAEYLLREFLLMNTFQSLHVINVPSVAVCEEQVTVRHRRHNVWQLVAVQLV